jgi:hypothetical protein
LKMEKKRKRKKKLFYSVSKIRISQFLKFELRRWLVKQGIVEN